MPQVYIRTGRGAAQALPNAQVDEIIAGMRPLLRKQRYGAAVEQAVVDVGLALAGRPASGGGSGLDWFAVVFFGVVGAVVFRSIW